MSIKLLLQAPGLNLQAVVTDDALPELITITQKFRDQDATASGAGLPASTTGVKEPPTNGTSAQAANEEMIKAQLASHGAAELLNQLSREQLRAGINLSRSLRFYPHVPDLSIGRCGDGMELRIEHPAIGKKGWLRALFWIDEKTKTIYIVDLFWKKTNAISPADKL